MKVPAPPPDFTELLKELTDSKRVVLAILATHTTSMTGEYLTWDKARFKSPPVDLTHEVAVAK